MRSCDMNCCCDPDCTTEEKKLFSECSEDSLQEKIFGDRHCYPANMFYRQNIPYEIDRSNDGLFCVITDNGPSRELPLPLV